MKKVSDVFKSIRFAKVEPRGKPHSSTDDEEHGAVGEKEYNQQLKHVKKMAMQEEIKDKTDIGEYDQEGDMAKSDLRSIIANAQKLHDMIDDADNLPEWCQSKITLAEDYVSTVANYMTAEMNEETVNEISDTTLSSYKEKAKKSADDLSAKGQYRKSTNRWGNIMKATGKQIEKTTASIKKSLNREETEHLDEIGDPAEMYRKATQAAKAKLQTMKALDKTREYEKKRLEAAKLKTQKEEVEQVDEGLKTIYHKIMAKRAASKADDAADMDDEKEFRKQVDKSEYHRVKAGGKPTRINKNPDSKMLTTREEVEQVDEIDMSKTLVAYNKGKPEYAQAKIDTKSVAQRKAETDTKLAAQKKPFSPTKMSPASKDDMHKQIAKSYASHKPGQYVGDSVEVTDKAINEGRPSQRHPLEGHEYHKKTNSELEHIAKDAHAAAEAMKSHNTTAENKYRDQANDSATVRYFRKKNGMPDWYKKKYGHVNEEIEHLDEKNVPTSPEKWAQAKAQAKAKFDVYPSAYANGWAAKKYKEMGGGWKSVSEAKEDPPFDPDPKPRKQNVIPGKHGAGYSTARHLARMAMKKQSEKMKKPIKEEMSKKAQIVKNIAKKKKDSADSFQKDPIISKSEVKM